MIALRPLGRSTLRVSTIGVGTASLGLDYGIAAPGQFGRPPEAEAIRLLKEAAARGVRLYDTAPAYGDSERIVGAALGEQRECVIATKVSIPRDGAGRPLRGRALAQAIDDSLERSRAALGRDRLDIVQVHNATLEVLADGALLEALRAARARGQVTLLGASVYGEAEALKAVDAGFDVLQVAVSLLDQRMAKRVLPRAAEAAVGVVARSVFLKGALTQKAEFLPPELSALGQAIDRVRERFGVDWQGLPKLALRFCLSLAGVSTVLVGARTMAELETALAAAAEGPLSAADMERAGEVALADERLLNPSYWPVP